MKIVLSRKGFDSTYGGIPSPIINDTMLSMPIPSADDKLTFEELQYEGHTYRDILRQLSSRSKRFDKCPTCHLDPDIRENVRKDPESDWRPAFGQIDQAQSYLHKRNVGPGDLFLFFGRFQETNGSLEKGTLKFNKEKPIIHAIYGYMQIGEIIFGSEIKERNFHWHPHGSGKRTGEETNALYLPAPKLSFDKDRNGWGTFKFAESRVLTLSEKTATWKNIECLREENVDRNVNNKSKVGIYYQGQWQELVLKEKQSAIDWIKKDIFKTEDDR